MKRWRRPLLLIALLLLAGAVVNVAVAWAAFAGHRLGLLDQALFMDHYDANSSYPPPWHSPPPATAYSIGTFTSSTWGVSGAESDWIDSQDLYRRRTWVCGWPRLSLRAVYQSHGSINQPDITGSIGLKTPWRRGFLDRTDGRLPTQPLTPGFAINTVFYAGILALPLSFLPIRRRLRARRGRCPKCGYDLAGLADPTAPCPECGAAR